ncbi:MAG: phosphosulfolactate synthase [Thaumarchaeota archaeon]|nr:phosphosulfolactate synthase [Nitrososphaerota archaeon]
MARRFLDFLEVPDRPGKPRTKGITMVLPVEPHPIAANILRGYSQYIDIVKVLDREMWAPSAFVKRVISTYRKSGIDVQFGGIPFEMARLQGKEAELAAAARALGVNVIEYETHVAKADSSQKKSGTRFLKKRGFKVVGEVGAKWAWKDETRSSLGQIDVGKMVGAIGSFIDAGCDLVYLEGRVVVNLIGKNLDNGAGQKQLTDVVSAFDASKLLFEVWGPEMTLRGPAKYWAWLISRFGPDTNFGNVVPEAVAFLESVRRGVSYEMDHPYLRWLEAGRPKKEWWTMESPPYDLYI